ncbi:hypothetical protein GCM10009529_22040 [Micropruina glycogenica]
MNGKGSIAHAAGAKTFHAIQATMITVIQIRKLAVPMNRANPSAKLPKTSESIRTFGSSRRSRPGVLRRSLLDTGYTPCRSWSS